MDYWYLWANRRIRRVSELLDDQRNWKVDKIREIFSPIDADAILTIKPSRCGDNDVLAWQPESSGVFTVRSPYKLALAEHPDQCALAANTSNPDGRNECWKKIWRSSVPPKVKIFAWKAASNGLATEENKLRRHMRVTGYCNICCSELEDVPHALFRCPHARRLWSEMRALWSLPSEADLSVSPESWFRSVRTQIPDHMVDMMLLLTWRVWFGRNEATHDKPLPTTEASKRFLISYIRLIRDIKHTPTDTLLKGKQPAIEEGILMVTHQPKNLPDKAWLKPPEGWVKLTIDGSFRESDHLAGLGMVLRNEEGWPVFSACRFISDCESPYEAESRACLEGLELALQFSQLPIIIESDCAKLIEAMSSRTQDRSSCVHLVSEIKYLSSHDRVCVFVKVERSQVRVSHCLANLVRTERCIATWLGSGPEDVLHILERYCSFLPAKKISYGKNP
jgi:ribonuclease HI